METYCASIFPNLYPFISPAPRSSPELSGCSKCSQDVPSRPGYPCLTVLEKAIRIFATIDLVISPKSRLESQTARYLQFNLALGTW
jgi:hypothetical protein